MIHFCCLLLSVGSFPGASQDVASKPDLRALLETIDDHGKPPSPEALARLREAGIAALEALKDAFPDLSSAAPVRFRSGVLPHLDSAEAGRFILQEVEAGLPVYRQGNALQQKAREQGQTREIAEAFERLQPELSWWNWSIWALRDVAPPDAYERVRALFMEVEPQGFPSNALAMTMVAIDEKRAMSDFLELWGRQNADARVRAVAAWSQARRLPEAAVLEAIFRASEPEIQEASIQLFHLLDRSHLDLLLSLVSHDSERIRQTSEYYLVNLAYLTPRQQAEVTGNATNPEERRQAWVSWWSGRRNLSEEELKAEAFPGLLAEAQEKLDVNLIGRLVQYREHAEVYALFAEVLKSENAALRQSVLNGLATMISQGSPNAVEFVFQQCAELPPEKASELAGTLRRCNDPRVVPTLLGLLAKAPGDNERWHSQILLALKEIGDERALDAMLYWTIEKGDHTAADALAELPGAEKVLPQLLEAVITPGRPQTRYAISRAIRHIGGPGLPEALVRLLPRAPGGDGLGGGPRVSVLELIEAFPHPAVKPQALALLRSDEPWTRLHAARVLGKLGDHSGVPTLLADINCEGPISASFSPGHVGTALKDIDAPETKDGLIRLLRTTEGKSRLRVLGVISIQAKTDYIPFIEPLLDEPDEKLSTTAAMAISGIVYGVTRGEHEREDRWFRLAETELPPIRAMVRWAFRDEKLQEGDRSFTDHGTLQRHAGAMIRVSPSQYILYAREQDRFEVIDVPPGKRPDAPDGKPAGRQGAYTTGSIERMRAGDYLVIHLSVGYGGVSYLFKRVDGEWQAVGQVGSVIE